MPLTLPAMTAAAAQAIAAARQGDIDNRVTGSIGDGPIVGARLRVYSQSGQMLRNITVDTADYDTTISTPGQATTL